MLSRFLLLRRLANPPSQTLAQTLTLISAPPLRSSLPPPSSAHAFHSLRSLSTHRGNGDDGSWKFTPENDDIDSIFGRDDGDLSGISAGAPSSRAVRGDEEAWSVAPEVPADLKGGLFSDVGTGGSGGGGGDDGEWKTAEGYTPWTIGGADDGKGIDLFADLGESSGNLGLEGIEGEAFDEGVSIEEKKRLEEKERELQATLKGPNRSFGDLIAQSGITEDMIDSLILLKDTRGVKGLPPLEEIEDDAIARLNATSSRAEIERKKQEEIAESRVRKVDEKGRAYGTGRRKCSIARVWVTPGTGKFIVNDKEFDAYFPILDHRAELLRPFNVTNTLGLWDVNCTVKGGGVSGQVGAIRLGVSRALENWEPGFRAYLKSAGYLTRDSRIVERKKPGQAKARKKFQWVKR